VTEIQQLRDENEKYKADTELYRQLMLEVQDISQSFSRQILDITTASTIFSQQSRLDVKYINLFNEIKYQQETWESLKKKGTEYFYENLVPTMKLIVDKSRKLELAPMVCEFVAAQADRLLWVREHIFKEIEKRGSVIGIEGEPRNMKQKIKFAELNELKHHATMIFKPKLMDGLQEQERQRQQEAEELQRQLEEEERQAKIELEKKEA
jgi:hypothetical protein